MKTKLILSNIFLVLLLFSSCSKEEKTIGMRENIHHDDFNYSVQSVEKTSMLEGKKANGMFYLVTFKVQSDAKRVEHKWSNNIAFIEDEGGNIYENNNELQKLLNSAQPFGYKDNYVTGAGVTESTILVFDVPNSVKEPYLKVRGDFLMGDFFDGNQFKNTKIKLF